MGRNNIVLIGFMGTGKTTIGKIVSDKLGYKFMDTDEEIEKQCKLKISEIFRLKGEKYFRELENQVAQRVANLNKTVISCGGGVVKNVDNISGLKRSGLLICLKADPNVIYSRISNNNSRPLASQRSKEEIISLIGEREEFYNVADIFIDTTEESPILVANRIIDIYKHVKI